MEAIPEHWVEFAGLYSRSSWFSLTYSSVCVLIPNFWFIPPCLVPSGNSNLSPMSVSLSLLRKSGHVHHSWALFLPRVHFISRRCWRQCQSLTLIHYFPEQTLILQLPLQGRAGWPRFLLRLLSLPRVQWHGLSQSAKCKHSMRAWPCVLAMPWFIWHVTTLGWNLKNQKRGPAADTFTCHLPLICLLCIHQD